ncbi:MAG: hypothetical protein WD602_06755 [Actinomycetota bacterium]
MAGNFEDLFLAEYPRVLCIAERVLRKRTEAEQLAREVMAAFGRTWPALPDDCAVRLHRAALDASFDRARDKRLEDAGGEAGVSDAQVTAALVRMPRPSAEVLVLRSSRLTYAETAAVLQVEEEQIGAMLRRAELRLLREAAV